MNTCKWCAGTVKTQKGATLFADCMRWQCSKCGSFGYDNEPTLQMLSEVYNSAYGASEKKAKYATGSTDKLIANSLLKAVGFSELPSTTKCLDYGGGSGDVSRVLFDKGVSTTVFEPYGKRPTGLPMAINWLNKHAEIAEGTFDYVFMVEVVEHLLEPLAMLNNIFTYLRPGGKLVITTPNAKGWRARLDGFDWREAQNPTHINLFSENTLRKILEEVGFEKIKRVRHPVTYRKKGIQTAILSITQRLGVDGGLRFVVEKPFTIKQGV
jgi:2-polyprenyl-3-methyl-5-hydroxy-6-metoxy-1,4-benzoquinol methylase